MNFKDIFRNLVTGKFIHDFDYSQKLSFKTVFYQSAYIYRCCECAFEHEYIEYITPSGEIDEEMYYKILQNIISGKCPHVDGVNECYIRETCVPAIYIAAAVGPKVALQQYFLSWRDCLKYRRISKGLFSLSPFGIAVFKGKIDSVTSLCNSIPNHKRLLRIFEITMKCAYRTEFQRQTLTVHNLSPVEFCIRGNKRQLLKAVLRTSIQYDGINKALEYTFKHNLKDMQDDLLEYIEKCKLDENFVIGCAASAIVYDQPIVLGRKLSNLIGRWFNDKDGDDDEDEENDVWFLSFCCKLLNTKACEDILDTYLSDYFVHDSGKMNVASMNLHRRLRLLYENYDDFNKEIEAQYRANPLIKEAVSVTTSLGTPLHACAKRCQLYPEEVKFLLNLGLNVDSVDMNGRTALMCFLHQSFTYIYAYVHEIIALRTIIEMLLYENPSVDIIETVVETIISLDVCASSATSRFSLIGEYVTDNQIHSRMSRSSSNCSVAIDYFTPLLIECGFPVIRDTLVDALDKPLPACELEYIRQYIQTPRSLMLRCRDVIRRHYRRRQVHRIVEVSGVPRKIKDFILRKPHFVRFE